MDVYPWQRPNQTPVEISTASLANNATQLLLSTSLGQIFLHDIFLYPQLNANATALIQAFDGVTAITLAQSQNIIQGVPANAFSPYPPVFPFGGILIPNSTNTPGIQIQNVSGNVQRWGGYLTWSLYPLAN